MLFICTGFSDKIDKIKSNIANKLSNLYWKLPKAKWKTPEAVFEKTCRRVQQQKRKKFLDFEKKNVKNVRVVSKTT